MWSRTCAQVVLRAVWNWCGNEQGSSGKKDQLVLLVSTTSRILEFRGGLNKSRIFLGLVHPKAIPLFLAYYDGLDSLL